MKKIIPILLAAVALTCCVSRKSADKLANDRDSLSVVVAEKDSIINDIFFSLNQISENLAAIKARENIMNASVDNDEIRKQSTVQINEDIQAIDELLQHNRATIARLQRSAAELKKARIRITDLEKLIKELNGQVEARDRQIEEFKERLRGMDIQIEQMNTDIASLGNTVSSLAGDKSRLEEEVKESADRLHKAYYIVGSQKELLSKEIIYKSGFIGRTLRVNENHSLDTFTQVDIRGFDQVIVGKKDVSIVTTHPAESYELVMGDGICLSLVIKDQSKFWEYSKVLVVTYK
ncbi:hypothetical protein FACS1894159_10590 [Bacteroidia bacterium]|nr:hypothetical protein FACS1894159_10590 [Bacteroidia bacterium]